MSERKLAHNWHEVAVQCMLGTIEKILIGPDGEVRAKANAPERCFEARTRWFKYTSTGPGYCLARLDSSGLATWVSIGTGQEYPPGGDDNADYLNRAGYTEIDEAEFKAILASKGVKPKPEPQPARTYPWYASAPDCGYRRVDGPHNTVLVEAGTIGEIKGTCDEAAILRDIAAGTRRELTPYQAMMLLDESARCNNFPALWRQVQGVQAAGGDVGPKEPKE